MLGYMQKTRYLLLIIEIDNSGEVHIYIDSTHAAYRNRKEYSGLHVMIDRGAMINQSKKLGVVRNSLTETEIISTSERFPQCTQFRYFGLSHSDDVKEDILMQDNISVIMLQKNYPYSARKETIHIHARYYFIIDKINNKEVTIIYYPTKKIITDFSSKRIQGLMFKQQRNDIIGLKEKDFEMYKAQYRRIIKKYDLWDEEEDHLERI